MLAENPDGTAEHDYGTIGQQPDAEQEKAAMTVPRAGDRFATVVSRFMTTKGIDRAELGRRLGKQPSYVSRLVRGLRIERRTVQDLADLSQALRLSAIQQEELLLAAHGVTVGDEVRAYYELLSNTLYLENSTRYRREKEMLAERVVTDPELLGSWRGLGTTFLDSGSTVAAVAHAMVERKRILGNQMRLGSLITNNFVAAFYLAAHGIPSFLLGGRLDLEGAFEAYAALLGPSTVDAFKNISKQLTTTVMSTTALTFEEGPCSRSPDNKEFKSTMALAAMGNGKSLIIVGDYSKLFENSNLDWPILEPDQWEALLDYPRFFLVLGGAPPSRRERTRFETTVAAFRDKLGRRVVTVSRS